MLFGCPLELRAVGELNKIPPVLEYLLDSVRDQIISIYTGVYRVGQKDRTCVTNSLYYQSGERWHLVNEIEQAWTGVEESDRAFISKLAQANLRSLILVCLL